MKALTLEYIRTSKLSICYTDEQIQALLNRVTTEGSLPVLLSIPRADAVRVCLGLLAAADAAEVAKGCAERARRYAADAYCAGTAVHSANAADAADAANVAVYCAANATYAAHYAAHYAARASAAHYAAAYADADNVIEHELTIRDCVKRLGWE